MPSVIGAHGVPQMLKPTVSLSKSTLRELSSPNKGLGLRIWSQKIQDAVQVD